MTRKTYNKLVRDRIPEIIIKNGGSPKTTTLNDVDYQTKLKEKLVEEATELLAEKEDVLNELADVLELVISIGKNHGLKYSEIEKKRKSKNTKRGGFKKRIFLEWVDE